MKLTIAYLAIVGLLSLQEASGQHLVVHERRHEPLRKAIGRRRIEKKTLLPMRIGLRHNSEAANHAEAWLMAVSDPKSPNYGQHWNQQEVIEAFKPSKHVVQSVTEWLSSHGISNPTHSDNRLWIAFDMPAEQAETMLSTEYFEHQVLSGRFEASADHYSLPAHLQPHIDYIKPGVKAADITGRTKRSREHFGSGESRLRLTWGFRQLLT